MITTDVKNYDAVFQKYILTQVFNSPDVFVRCKNILKPEYFEKTFHAGIEFILNYSLEYDTLPTLENVQVKTGLELPKEDVSHLHHESLLKDVGDYCRHKAIENAIMAGAELVGQKRYGAMEQLIKEAMLVSLQSDMGLDIYNDPTSVINSLAQMQGNFSTGWETLDFKLFGGFGKQELEIFAAESGGGKSVVLQNLAVNFSKMGKRGAYITLELAEELVSVRIYGMLIDTAPTKVRSDVDDAAARIKIEERTNGNLIVKRLPESITTVNDIEAYLRELQIRTGEKLDYICVDYLDLLTSDRCIDKSNVFLKDKYVSEELRSLAFKMDFTVFTACQFNRGGINDDSKSQANIAGGISKIYTADNVIYILTNKDRGEMVFDFQKTRNSSAVGSRLKMSYNIDTLRVLDHEVTIDELEQHTSFKHSGKSPVGSGAVVGSSVYQKQTASKEQTKSANTIDALKNRLQPQNVTEPKMSTTTHGTINKDGQKNIANFLSSRA